MTKKAHITTEFDGFRVEIDEAGERGDIVLDRPPFNVVTMKQRAEMAEAFATLDGNEGVRVIVLRSAGKHFSSGGDIAEFLESTPEAVSHLASNVMAPERCQKPVVAAIRGYCFGVGFEFSLACDFRITSESAVFALPEQRIGMIPGSGGSIRLLHMIGMQRTKDLVLRSRRLPADQAHVWGIVLDCVPDEELEHRTADLVDELRSFSPLAQRTIKGVLNAAQNTPVHVGIETEGQAYGRLRSSNDFREGVESFYQKRKPKFTGT